jgi:hypothetical protein
LRPGLGKRYIGKSCLGTTRLRDVNLSGNRGYPFYFDGLRSRLILVLVTRRLLCQLANLTRMLAVKSPRYRGTHWYLLTVGDRHAEPRNTLQEN